jgi:cobalamin biosynthesis protein CobT
MNDDVRILREAVVKVTQLLAGMGLKVTQRGTTAFVGTNRVTHKPEVVNIPYLPDNASEELILAIQGFIDHEVAHILETDFSVHTAIDKAQKDFPFLRSIWNTLEDTFIEGRMAKRFAGSGYNLEQLHKFFLSDITTPVYTAALAKGDVDTAFSALFVPAFRAYSGQRLFQEFMKAGDFDAHPELGPKFKCLAPFVAEVSKLSSTWECFELAKRISTALKAPPLPPAPPMPAPPPPPPPSEDEEQPENEPQGENGGAGETPEDEGMGPAEEPKDEQPEEQDDAGKPSEGDDESKEDTGADASGDAAGGDEAPAEEEPGEGASADGDDGDTADATGEAEGDGEDDAGEPGNGASDDDDGEDQDAEADAEGDGAGASEEAGDDQEGSSDDEEGEVGVAGGPGEDQEPGDEGSEGDDDASEDGGDAGGQDAQEDPGEAEPGEGNAPGNAGAGDEDEAGDQGPVAQPEEDAEGKGNGDPNTGGPVVLVGGVIEYDEQIAAKIGDEARDMTATAPYRIYTKDFDVIEPFPTDMANYRDEWVTQLDDRTRQSVGMMQKEIQRMMAARSQSVKVPGFRSGRLHTAGLHRLAAGDDRVFRRLHVNESKDIAVGLLIDNSGSMEGIKVQTAMEAGYALSSTLERVGIQHEVLGFTTKWHPWGKEIQEAREAANASGIPYSRYEPIYMPVYKGFDERLTFEVKRRFAAAPHQDLMGSNVDGESVEYAAYRLLRRKETRKVLLVLSDGNPIADGDVKGLRRHLKETVEQVEKRGIETVGIGILTDAPRHYYPKFALLNNAAELPKCVMGELKRILLS